MGDGKDLAICEDDTSSLDPYPQAASSLDTCPQADEPMLMSLGDWQPATDPSGAMSWLAPQLTPSTRLLTFQPTHVARVQSMSVAVENPSQYPVEIADATITPIEAAKSFEVGGLGSGSPIEPGRYRAIEVVFRPVDVGTVVGTLWLLDADDVPLATIQLQGVGEEPPPPAPPPYVPGARWEEINVRQTPPYILGAPPFTPIAPPPRPPVYVPPVSSLGADTDVAMMSVQRWLPGPPIVTVDRPLPDECYPPYDLSPLEEALLCERFGAPVPTKTRAAAEAHRAATHAASEWHVAAERSIDAATVYLYDNWLLYLRLTSSWPRISRSSLPDPAYLYELMSTDFGEVITQAPPLGSYHSAAIPEPSFAYNVGKTAAGDVLTDPAIRKHVAGWFRRNVAKSAVRGGSAAVGASVVGASVGGPVGWAVGFAIGALVETVAGLLFDRIVGEPDLTPLLRAAYEQGWKDASEAMGRLLQDKSKELEVGRLVAKEALLAQKRLVDSAIAGTNDAAVLQRCAAELQDWARGAVWTAPNGTGFANALLGLWLRDHAASPYGPAAGVHENQWREVADRLAKIPKSGVHGVIPLFGTDERTGSIVLHHQPDLFIRQTAYDWETIGIIQAPALTRRMYQQLGLQPEQVNSLDPQKAEEYAELAFKRFDHVEFVWSADELSTEFLNGLDPALTGISTCPPDPIDLLQVSCELNLERHLGSVWALSWFWTFRKRGRTTPEYRKRTPKDRTWQWMHWPARYHIPATRELEGEKEVQRLRDLGLTVLEEGDARDHVWLQTVFGSDVAVPRIERADATPHPIRVYRVKELLPNYDPPLPEQLKWPGVVEFPDLEPGGYSTADEPQKPRRPIVGYLTSQIHHYERRWHPPFIMYRSGDVIIVVEFFYYTGRR